MTALHMLVYPSYLITDCYIIAILAIIIYTFFICITQCDGFLIIKAFSLSFDMLYII